MAELSFDCRTSSSTTSGTTGSGISEEDHENIDSLVHNISENAFIEIVRNAQNQVTDVNVKTSEIGGILIRSTAITRNSSNQVSEVEENQHDGSGTIIQTLTTTVNRTDGKVVSLDLVET